MDYVAVAQILFFMTGGTANILKNGGRKKRINKYKNIRTTTLRGTFASKKEARDEQELNIRKRAREIKNYACQVPFRIDINKKHICTYIADFVILHNDGSEEIVDSKGFLTQVFRLKFKLMKAVYPKYKYTILK